MRKLAGLLVLAGGITALSLSGVMAEESASDKASTKNKAEELVKIPLFVSDIGNMTEKEYAEVKKNLMLEIKAAKNKKTAAAVQTK